MTEQLSKFEQDILAKLLDGEHPILEQLRKQLPACRVNRREYTGVGFYTYFGVDNALSANDVKMCFGDVLAEIEGIVHGVGFVLYVEHGRLHMLEGYGYDESWPVTITSYVLRYSTGEARDWSAIKKVIGY
jgi:hypothetical protein